MEDNDLRLTDNTIYFNGYSFAVGAGDVVITLMLQGKPIATLNASYTVCKTLALALNNSMSEFEKLTNHKIMTVDDVKGFIEKSKGQK